MTHRSRRRRRLAATVAALATGLLGVVVAAPAGANDVYTTPGEHPVNGRLWRTACEPYSSTVDRCRTEIWATTVHWTGSRYTTRQAWVFNNLTYLPSNRKNWVGNPLATPGEHVINGRRWKTECDTAWTGMHGCRSMILATVPQRSGSGYVTRDMWVFNNIVQFFPPGVTVPPSGPITLFVPRQLDPMATTRVEGRLSSGEAGAAVVVEIWNGSAWQSYATTTTGSDGRWSVAYSHGVGTLGSTLLRARATLGDGTDVVSPSTQITRMRWANAVVTQTTAAEVASTYRAGCPVGPSKLRTIRINQLGMDGRVHRGEIIVRDVHADRIVRVFTRVFEAGFPVAQMRNPNHWNGSDPAMMAANNTSGFNCRSVVGNPYAQSPHSYGIAVDVNPVQNPYRDPNGKWWPSTQYVSRTPVVPGMLTSSSAPVVAFRDNSFEWYSGWDWHHFQYKSGLAARTIPQPQVSIDDSVLLQPRGWSQHVPTEMSEDGQAPTGHWTRAVDPALKARDILALSCSPAGEALPEPVGALEGTLEANGSPGVSVALRFESETAAATWFAAWQSQTRACARTSVTELESTDSTWLGTRSLEQTWSEAALRQGTTVALVIVADGRASDVLREALAARSE